MEFIEEYPLIITTFGMASKLIKYVYHNRVKKILKDNKENPDEEDLNLSLIDSLSKTDVKSKS